jgi:hypothetical protein
MRKSTIIKDLQDMLAPRLPVVKYIDKDWGQLSMDPPPVGWPCILIDFEQVDPKQLSGGDEKDTAIIVLTVANRRTTSSSAHAPRAAKEASYITIDLTDDINDLVQGYSAGEYSPLSFISFYKQNDIPGAECYAMRYRTTYKVTPSLMAIREENQ